MPKKIIVEYSQTALKALIENENACVTLHKSVYSLALYPYHLSDLNTSIRDLLHAKFAKYQKELGGILLGYKNVKVLTPDARIITDSCFLHLTIEADFYIFKPERGATLNGIVNKKSKDHVGCLVHSVFNVSVPNCKDEEYWIGYDVNLGDEVLLQVVHIDLDASLPYIRAIFLSNTTLIKHIDDSGFSQNIDDLNISGIAKLESTSKAKKRKKLKMQSLDETQMDISSQNMETPKEKKHKKSSKINGEQPTTEILNGALPKEKKHKKLRKSDINETMDQSFNSISHSLNNETPIETKSKRSRKSFEINDIDKNLNISLQADILNNVTPNDKKSKKSRKSLNMIDNSNPNIKASEIIDKQPNTEILNGILPKEKKHKKSLDTINNLNNSFNSTGFSLNNEIPNVKKRKKSRKSSEINDNFDNQNRSLQTEISNSEAPKNKTNIKSRTSLELLDNSNANINLSQTDKPKKRKNSVNNTTLDLSSEQKSSGKKHKIKLELNVSKTYENYETDKHDAQIKAESCVTPKIKKEPSVTPKIKKELSLTPKIKSEKRKSKIPVDNLKQTNKNEHSAPSQQLTFWNNIAQQMHDSELENTLGNYSNNSQNLDITNTIERKSKKRKHSLSDLEESRKKRKRSITEIQETDLSIVSPKKKHKSKKTDI